MPQFNPSCIKTFTIPGDATNLYAMIDESIVTKATANLTTAQKALVNSYRFTPTQVQLQGDPTTTPPTPPVVPQWAGNDPPSVYFKATKTQMQAALARWYK